MEILVGVALQSSFALTEVREFIGLVAALSLAVVTALGSWHVTDRLVALRQRPDED